MPAVAVAAASAVPPEDRVPARYARYTALILGVAICSLVAALLLGRSRPWAPDGAFWTLAALCLAGELLTIRLARGASFDEVTVSTAFAFAILLAFGPAPAMVLYAVVSVVADAATRTAPVRIAFNAAQYAISVGAAGLVLALMAGGPQPGVPGDVLAVVSAGAVLFAVNHVLAGVGAAILTRRAIRPYLLGDLGFHAWAAGFQLALAPALVACARVDVLLVVLTSLPLAAVWLGGRQAVLNQHRALHDELTDLPNRSLFSARLEHALGSGQRLSVLLADLDEFKAVNDSLGHHLGDVLLQRVADRLRAAVPEGAVVARLGGDEFAVLLPGAGSAEALSVAEALLAALERPLTIESFSLDVRASVGIATRSGRGEDAHALLRQADTALYRAKETRTRHAAYVEHDGAGFDRLALAAELRRAIERDELVLHYQPKLSLKGHGTHGVEALVRWQHPALGLLSPEGFIPVAEQSNLIGPLTDWVLATALDQCRSWRAAGLDLRVAVNLSTRSLLDRELPAAVAAALATAGLPASVLQLEITESRIVADFGRAREVLHDLRALGVRVAIDDFGTGYSSLAQLQRLPADEIKIDRSFVMDMETNGNNAAIVRSTIDLGRNLALDVTAEGVETSGARDQLIALGCDYAQGYYLGRPSLPDACERDIRTFVAAEGPGWQLAGPPLREPA